jgi:hypothetical protein
MMKLLRSAKICDYWLGNVTFTHLHPQSQRFEWEKV